MSDSTTIRIDRITNDQLKSLASLRGESMADTVARAIRLLEEETIGDNLAAALRDDEHAWLDADAG
ncbi:MAG TPA: hypothetical protein H9878_11060 [Candidatus Dietzia merdigallinarum]|nr:hypothetical protein [Candidatus Dietzia merdigallinarum]